MTAHILLDYEGNFDVPDNVCVVQTEIEFLREALSGQPLLIRGARLCSWAENFYRLRGWSTSPVTSLQSSLRHNFPALSTEQAHELAAHFGAKYLSEEPLSAVLVLKQCYPDDYALWQGQPATEHAAHWLIWLTAHTPTQAELVILKAFAEDVRHRAVDTALHEIYAVISNEQSLNLLQRWLGAAEPPITSLGEFPISLPPNLLVRIKDDWMKLIIHSKGDFFRNSLSLPIPTNLRQILAQQTADFLCINTHFLTRTALHDLQPYISKSIQSKLEDHLPPPIPAPLPESESDVVRWFQTSYLPYRRWQERVGDESACHTMLQSAQTFAHWVLQRYPIWLIDGNWLTFQKSAQLPKDGADTLTFCVILDGLPAWDAEEIVRTLASDAPRLSLTQKEYCFTALPTVTEFAKDALLKGVPPYLARQNASFLGDILSDGASIKTELQLAQIGQLFFWRVSQPDSAYHFEQDEKRERRVSAELETIKRALTELLDMVPDQTPLRILLTSDHGRLCTARSVRRVNVPDNMQAHGRAAWGTLKRVFPESGYEVSESENWVELSGDRFGLPSDQRLVWDDSSFYNGKNGYEAFPHGGLFPEEVLVPWFVFVRDAEAPTLEATIHGSGEAGFNGELNVKILNRSHLQMELLEITFNGKTSIRCTEMVKPLSETRCVLSLMPWPTQEDLDGLTATLTLRQPNGVTFIQSATLRLEARTLYARPNNILKGFGL